MGAFGSRPPTQTAVQSAITNPNDVLKYLTQGAGLSFAMPTLGQSKLVTDPSKSWETGQLANDIYSAGLSGGQLDAGRFNGFMRNQDEYSSFQKDIGGYQNELNAYRQSGLNAYNNYINDYRKKLEDARNTYITTTEDLLKKQNRKFSPQQAQVLNAYKDKLAKAYSDFNSGNQQLHYGALSAMKQAMANAQRPQTNLGGILSKYIDQNELNQYVSDYADPTKRELWGYVGRQRPAPAAMPVSGVAPRPMPASASSPWSPRPGTWGWGGQG